MTCTSFPCVSSGRSQISSKKMVPLLDCSKRPKFDSFLFRIFELSSQPNKTSSTLSGDKVAHEATVNGKFFLSEFLCIHLAINSLPDPEGPVSRTLLLLKEIFSNSVTSISLKELSKFADERYFHIIFLVELFGSKIKLGFVTCAK